MTDLELRQCIADVCSATEVALKLLQQIGPMAVSLAAMSQGGDPAAQDTFVQNCSEVERLGGFRAAQDGLHLLADVQQRLRNSS